MFGLDSIALRIACITLGVIAVFGFGYYKGHAATQEKFDAYKNEVAILAKAQQDKNEYKKKIQSQINNKSEADHEKSISNIRGVYSTIRVQHNSGSCGVSKVPDTAKQPAEAASYYVSVAPELAIGCAETTQQLVDLQDWIKQQGEVE